MSESFIPELLNLTVNDEGVRLREYSPTQTELEVINREIVSEIKQHFADDICKIDLTQELWHIVVECLGNSKTVHDVQHGEHTFELSHGRTLTTWRWLNPRRNEPGEQRYSAEVVVDDSDKDNPETQTVFYYRGTCKPMNYQEAIAWAKTTDTSVITLALTNLSKK